jgi:hypothetical protein
MTALSYITILFTLLPVTFPETNILRKRWLLLAARLLPERKYKTSEID